MAFAAGCADSSSGGGGSDSEAPFDGGILGFSDASARLTQCGECHPSQQADWEQTRHANAYATLEAIGQEGADRSCAPCHNVSDLGNEVVDPSLGFVGTPVAELHNVQCENCHGPGAEHKSDVTLKPFAPIDVGFDVGCGECHQDAHHPFVDEWLDSAHSRSLEAAGGSVATNTACARCHVAQSFIAYVESGGEDLLIVGDPAPLTCVTCHDPHGNGAEKQLRQLDGQPIVCTECHNQEDSAPGGVPHHPQANMLLGEAGFIFPGETNPGPAAHGSIETNPDLCATCHIATRAYMGGEFPIPAEVGHRFEPIPVLDEATGERNFTACLECHANPESILEEQQGRVRGLIADLEAALAAVPEGQQGNAVVTQAQFNLDSVVNDGSTGVHNPRLAVLLLESSLDRVNGL